MDPQEIKNIEFKITRIKGGYDPDEVFEEIAEDNKKLDKLGIVLDSDARKVTNGGMLQQDPDAAPAKNGGQNNSDSET